MLIIITLMYLSGLIWAQYVTGWSPYSWAPLDKVGGNYRGFAWLSSQGHFFFFYFDRTKQQGVSLPYIFRTPGLSPLNVIALSISAALSLPLLLCACIVSVSLCACMHIWALLWHIAKMKAFVSCVVFDSASNKRRTLLLLFFRL